MTNLLKEANEQTSFVTASTDQELEILPEPLPKLNSSAFYGIAGKFAQEATKDSEADPLAVLMQTLSYFAIAAGRKKYFRVGFSNHHPRLFVVLVGNTSKARKGTSWEPVKALFKRIKDIGGDVPDSRPGPFSSGEGIIYAVRDPSAPNSETNESKDLGVLDKRLFVCTSEFAAGLKVMRREGNILSTVIRSLFDGDDIAPLVKNNPMKATAPHGGIAGHITRQELARDLDKVEIFNGFGNRFLWPFIRRPKLVPFPKAIEDSHFNELAAQFKKALNFAQQPGEVLFTNNLNSIWAEIYKELQKEAPGVAGVMTNRGEVQVIRLALIFALLDQSSVIDVPHMRTALAIWDYCKKSVLYLFGGELDEASTRILTALSEKPHSQTEISELFSRHLSGDKLRQKLSELESLGKIEREIIQVPGTRTKTIWKLVAGG